MRGILPTFAASAICFGTTVRTAPQPFAVPTATRAVRVPNSPARRRVPLPPPRHPCHTPVHHTLQVLGNGEMFLFFNPAALFVNLAVLDVACGVERLAPLRTRRRADTTALSTTHFNYGAKCLNCFHCVRKAIRFRSLSYGRCYVCFVCCTIKVRRTRCLRNPATNVTNRRAAV